MKQTCGTCLHSQPTDVPGLVLLKDPCPYAGYKADVDDQRTCQLWKAKK